MNPVQSSTLQRRPAESNNGTTRWNPAVGFHESDGVVVVHVELPGVDQSAIDACVENNILTICREGGAARSFTLATAVDPAKACTTVEAGVLTITLPKAERAESKTMPIARAARA